MKYSPAHDEGLGLSLVVYTAAMIAVLSIIGFPIYWLNSPTVYDNPGAQAAVSSSLYGPVRERKEFPLAVLKSPEIVSPAMMAAANASEKKTADRREGRVVRRASHSAYAQAPQSDQSDRPHRPLLFGLF